MEQLVAQTGPAVEAAHIEVRRLSKSFSGSPLYTDFDVDFPRGKIVSIFGPNGCGKSTLMNMIAGITPIDSGDIRIGGKTVKESRIGYVFQQYREAMFPWLRAWDNIAWPLRIAKVPEAEVKARVDSIVASFEIRFDLHRYPYELSGGQQQTVCIMRALVTRPEVLFLDEPFSALDYEMTLFIREKLQDIQMRTGTTMVIVSHDLEDAVFLADKVLLLTRRPTRIAEYLPFPLGRPRTAESMEDPLYLQTRSHALAVFKREAWA
ncbi:ABC transporter ATP-binding protein [Chthonobacter rhizosphaerae]|uniref:ABC transporter ATP-binding protein n=1 Tax=Chthonobacter rhizosphaerae TaxID=2735553 RepID=UPI001FE9DB61|nr:ABC transporter ATP-binding protein [Chthonobacter rhizosphaerae]